MVLDSENLLEILQESKKVLSEVLLAPGGDLADREARADWIVDPSRQCALR